jgi:DNA topoisomerase-2
MAKKSIEEEYKLLSQEEQILLRPDTTVGATIEQEKNIWAIVDTNDLNNIKVRKQTLKYIPAFLKLFDEILTNASDHVQRGGCVKNIKVTITKDWNISIWNDGKGIPVTKHKEHNIWLPEMLLGRLNSGSNYNDTDERYGAGRNGLGSGLVALFSSSFIIDCADGKNSYYQEINNNCKNREKAIVKSSTKSYTNVTYKADNIRLPILGYEEATLKLCIKRVLDIAVYNPQVKVYFNEQLININNIKDWCSMHLDESELFTEVINDKWSIGLAKSNTDIFENCSIVNGNTTWIGGTHVDYIMSNIVKRLTEDLTKGNKGIKIKPNDIKNSFHLFLIARIANPTFDTQTKENLTIKIQDKIDLSDKLYKQLLKSDIVKSILEWVQLKEQAELNKLNKSAAGKTIRVEKLRDAHKAGTNESHLCAILLAEGDSAAGGCLSGLSIVGRDYWGVFPLKGKPLNVRDASISRITDNDEIANVLKIVGLVPGKKYTSINELRYGKIVFMADSDCYEENTIILTDSGEKMMKDLQYGDKVLTHTGQYKSILNIINSIKKELVSYVVAGTEYLCSQYHRLLVMRNSTVLEIYAKDLTKNDYVLIKKNN